MKPAALFELDAVGAMLERAARVAHTPARVHFVSLGGEEVPVVGTVERAPCARTDGSCPGADICSALRVTHGKNARRKGHFVSWLCPLGLVNVSTPLLKDSSAGYTLTLGPFCPAEAVDHIEDDIRRGLAALEEAAPGPKLIRRNTPPADLKDMPIAWQDMPFGWMDDVIAVGEWVAESVDWLWQVHSAEAGADDDDEAALAPASRGKARALRVAEPSPYHAAELATALAGGDSARARALVRSVLAETPGGKRQSLEVRRARAIALVAATLEAAQRAQLPVGDAWDRFGPMVAAVHGAADDTELSSTLLKALAPLKPRPKRKAPAPARADTLPAGRTPSDASRETLARIAELVTAKMLDGITLAEVAAEIGKEPSAVTHWLQRAFGMSFSEYVGRLRVDKAKDLLRRTRLDIVEVARRVGVNDASNFQKLFRKMEGVSATAYRKRFRKKT